MTFDDILASLRQAEGDPQLLALATVDSVLATHRPELRAALEAAAIPHWFNHQILGILLRLGDSEVAASFETLTSLPFVERYGDGVNYNVHESTRLAIRRRLESQEPERLVTLSLAAAALWPDEDPRSRVENLYHRIVANQKDASLELERLYWKWHRAGQRKPIQLLGPVLEELSRAQLRYAAKGRVLLILGWVRLSRIPLPESKRLAEEAIALLDSDDALASRADAHSLLGDVLRLTGRLSDALAQYQADKRIRESIAALDPANSDWQRDLSVSHNTVGNIYQAQGRLSDALAEFQAYKRIMESLAALDPAHSDWQRELSVSHNNVGSIYQAQGLLREALSESESDLVIAERLANLDPTNSQWQEDLAITKRTVSSLRKRLGLPGNPKSS